VTGTPPTDFNYTGQRLDDTGLLYYNARYYDPLLGRFISPDTLIPDPTNVFDYDRYMYGRGNPVSNNDPSGHASCSGCIIDPRPLLMFLEDYGLANPLAFAYMPAVVMGGMEKSKQTQTGQPGEEALILTYDWYTEQGEQTRTIGLESKITQALTNDSGVLAARQKFLDEGRQDMTEANGNWYGHSFGLRNDITEILGDVVFDGDGNPLQGDWSTSFLGGYQVEVVNVADWNTSVLVEYRVTNNTTWQSATRYSPAGDSFKNNELRSDPGPGGNLRQTYVWQEIIQLP
jgi:RHS repeat-associated protein